MNEFTRHDSLLQLQHNLTALDAKVIDQASFFIDILTSYLDSIELDYSLDIIAEDHLIDSSWLSAYYADALYPHEKYKMCCSLLKIQLATYRVLNERPQNKQKALHLGRVITSQILIWVLAYYLQSQSAGFVSNSVFIKKLFGEFLSDWDDSQKYSLSQRHEKGLSLEVSYVGAYYWGNYSWLADQVSNNSQSILENELIQNATASYNFALFASDIVIHTLGGFVDNAEQFHKEFAVVGIAKPFLDVMEEIGDSDIEENEAYVTSFFNSLFSVLLGDSAEEVAATINNETTSITSAQIDREIVQYYINDSLDRKDKESFMLWTNTLNTLNNIERGREQTNERKRV